MESTPLGGGIGLFCKKFLSNFCFHMKDSKWGWKCIFMNCASRNGSPQQIQLRQLPFPNETKPRYHWHYLYLEIIIFILLCVTNKDSFLQRNEWDTKIKDNSFTRSVNGIFNGVFNGILVILNWIVHLAAPAHRINYS